MCTCMHLYTQFICGNLLAGCTYADTYVVACILRHAALAFVVVVVVVKSFCHKMQMKRVQLAGSFNSMDCKWRISMPNSAR